MGKKANKRKPPQRYRPQKQQSEQSSPSGESPVPAVDGESKEGEAEVRSKSRHFGRGELDKASDLCPECSRKKQAGKKQKQLRKKNMESSFEGVCSACKLKKGSKLRDDQPVLFQTQEGKNGVVRGLMNLGNTCFFNSVMQNLLAVQHLKDYFLSSVPVTEGPLTCALRRFFQELNAEPGEQENSTKKRWKESGTYNPKGLFSAICAKSSRFSSFQQQDSHELLRCLLDGLHVEQESLRPKGEDEKNSENDSFNFIDRFFGGQFASTVRCCDCGHSSSVLEPFLDISLPIPKLSTSTNKAFTPTSRSSTTTNLSKREIKARKILDRRKRPSVVKVATTNNTTKGEPEVEDCSWLDYVDVSAEQMTEFTTLEQDYVSAPITGGWDIDGEAADSPSVVVRDGWETSDLTAESTAGSTVVPDGPEAELAAASEQVPTAMDEPEPDKVAPEQNSYSAVVPDESQSNALVSDGWEGADSYISPTDGGIVYGPEPFNPATDDVLSGVNPSTSGVIYLPYKEEAQAAESSQQGWEVLPEPDDVDGIADLFHEEEGYNEPATGVMLGCANREDAVGGFEEEFEPLEEVVEESIAPMTLEGCLSAFTKLEVLSGENAWDCEKCSSKQGAKSTEGVDSSTTSSSNDAEDDIDSFVEGGIPEQATSADNGPGEACSIQAEGTKRTGRGRGKAKDDNSASVGRKATKSLVIRKAPPVLTVHLKRFAQDMRGRLSKLAGHVAFEELLNLEPFQGTKAMERCVYRLVGVVEHSGTMRGGHYVAFVRAGGSEDSKDSHWYYISDSHVRRTTLEQVLRSEAYLLFYERVGPA